MKIVAVSRLFLDFYLYLIDYFCALFGAGNESTVPHSIPPTDTTRSTFIDLPRNRLPTRSAEALR